MTHHLSHLALRLARRAFVLGVGFVGLATVAAASPKPRARHSSEKSHKSHKSSSTSRSSSRKHASAKKHTAVAEREDTMPSLPTVPSVMLLPSADLTLGTATPLTDAPAVMQAFDFAARTSSPLASFNASAERLLSAVVDRARSQLGTRYVFGGSEPGLGLDCSSFARFAMEALGIKLPRTAAQQARVGTPVPKDRTMLKPGDLLTFGRGSRVSHVGIYLGEGRFIHASVSSGRIIETTMERNRTLFRRWQGARRLIATGDSSAAGAF